MSLTYTSIFDFGLEPTAQLFNAAFADYFVSIQLPAAGLLAMARGDSVDLTLSRVALVDAQPAGLALIARRGWTSRLAGMALLPTARGQGHGAAFMQHLLAEARARADRAMVLEVIEQNTPAVRLYESCGFRVERRLVSYAGRPALAPSDLPLEEVDCRTVARALIADGPPDLPWQLSGETLAQMGPPLAAYRAGPAYIVISNPIAPTIAIRALVTEPSARRQGHASALLRAVMAQHPEATWRVPTLWPEELSGLFTKLGLQREALTQWQMAVRLMEH